MGLSLGAVTCFLTGGLSGRSLVLSVVGGGDSDGEIQGSTVWGHH